MDGRLLVLQNSKNVCIPLNFVHHPKPLNIIKLYIRLNWELSKMNTTHSCSINRGKILFINQLVHIGNVLPNDTNYDGALTASLIDLCADMHDLFINV